jgi:DNA-binding transcriptional MerR regulator
MGDGRMTITDVADKIGVTPKTIVRWEKAGKIQCCKRDWRGWRVYEKDDLDKLKKIKEAIVISTEDDYGR